MANFAMILALSPNISCFEAERGGNFKAEIPYWNQPSKPERPGKITPGPLQPRASGDLLRDVANH
ncbi:MAG TPA: hypothetical protein VMF90_13785 [Rhizobiaceae bacterium]|nr:hypothetical protein [Rhizobiaceae bacterium]